MSPQVSEITSEDRRSDGPRRLTVSECIERLVDAADEAQTVRGFLKAALETIATALGAPSAALELRQMSQVHSESWAHPPEQAAFWKQTVEGALTDALSDRAPRARLYQGKRGNGGVALLSAPLRSPEQTCSGALVVVTACADGEQARELLNTLAPLAFLTALLVESPRGAPAPREGGDASALSNLRKVAQYESTTELAYAITNKLRARDGCDTVVLARARGVRAEILSISGLDEITAKSPGVRCIQAAVEECLDVGMPIVNQPGNDLDPTRVVTESRLHALWTEQAGGAAVASIPLTVEDEVVAVLSVRRSPHASFTHEELDEFKALVEPYAGALDILENARRSLRRHVVESARTTTRRLLSRGELGLKALVLLPTLLAAWLAFGSLDHEVTVPATVEVAEARHVSCPTDGKLVAVRVRPGDEVRAGDLLCRFDTGELVLERASLLAELRIHRIRENQALAGEDPVEVRLALANRDQLQADLALLDHRIAAAEVRAPLDGVVVAGSLTERVGDVFKKGEPMFELAAGKGWRIELEIPERDVSEVTAGMAGQFASLARPEDFSSFRVRRVDPDAQQRDGRNVYVAEAEAALDADWVRSGMEGRARIDVGERAPWWVLFHDVEEWIRLHLWL